ncbi:hypothetical protein B2G71_17500 [Novosphingobium sp. PC22D]|uniref:M24 family metallopeptidase n=1 Tax=Novosphingobium sp. PC22D TaxID=1962403 RepID=UPI000BEFF889|nr:M24 family metallopeptidase [Novosphingobium sp. PC22D]PEQ11349.1 hypothetical protein B2G71_17500 [Novosphingobium sp. PC22D]
MQIRPLMNRARAQAVCERLGIDALVLADPLNIYHATGFWPQTAAMGQLGTSLAVVPADASAPVILVTSQFLFYFFDVTQNGAPEGVTISLFTAPDGAEDVAPPTYFARAEGGVADLYERATRTATDAHLARRPAFADARRALRDAVDSLGDAKVLAVDGDVASFLLGDGVSTVAAEPALRAVRMVKSSAEIELMRRAARLNAEAAREALASVGPGDSYQDLQRAFFARVGEKGGIPSFIQIDSRAYAGREGKITEGRAFLIDAVSAYERYHGDYGRTVIVGDPHPALMRALDAAMAANRAVSENLGPDMRYSDVMTIGRDAIAALGIEAYTPSSPHSVGLFHTDEAFEGDSPIFAKADHMIEPGMVLSVDCPILLTDIGGSVHLEDLWLITEGGCEPLNDISEPYIKL